MIKRMLKFAGESLYGFEGDDGMLVALGRELVEKDGIGRPRLFSARLGPARTGQARCSKRYRIK